MMSDTYELPLDEERLKQLPDPKGWKILCTVPEIKDTYESGLAKSERTLETELLLTTVLYVVKLGPDCYKETSKFPSGPYCKEGDFIVVRPNAGTRIKIHGVEFRLISDDVVEAVVENPVGITRN